MRKECVSWATAVGMVWAAAASGREPLTLAEAIGKREVHPLELEARVDLAAARRVLYGAHWAPQGAILSVGAGVRRATGSDEPDLGVDVEVPILLAERERRQLEEALAQADRVLEAGARAIADLEVERAYLEAWRDQAQVLVRAEAVTLLERWRTLTERRVEAGAEAPFRVVVAMAELERARVDLAEARGRASGSLGRLQAVVPRVSDEVVLEEPGSLVVDSQQSDLGVVAQAALAAGVLEDAIDAVGARVDSARWSLKGELAAEGDEDVARFGVSYRFPRAQEAPARRAVVEAARLERHRQLDVQLALWRGQLATARRVLLDQSGGLDEERIDGALRALEVLVEEGKAGLGEVLAERRSLIEARSTTLDRRLAGAIAAAEVRALTRRMEQ